MRTYCIGDIHGMSGLLRQALALVAVDAKDKPARVIFLGDYVDRGPDPQGVLDRLMAGRAHQPQPRLDRSQGQPRPAHGGRPGQ